VSVQLCTPDLTAAHVGTTSAFAYIGDREEDPTVAGGSCAAAGRRDILMMFGRESALTIGSGIALGLLVAAASEREDLEWIAL
jgi:hypothetical protein